MQAFLDPVLIGVFATMAVMVLAMIWLWSFIHKGGLERTMKRAGNWLVIGMWLLVAIWIIGALQKVDWSYVFALVAVPFVLVGEYLANPVVQIILGATVVYYLVQKQVTRIVKALQESKDKSPD